MQLATKFGICYENGQRSFRGDPAYVRSAFEASLKRLDVDYIDLYYQHRVDTRVPIEVTVMNFICSPRIHCICVCICVRNVHGIYLHFMYIVCISNIDLWFQCCNTCVVIVIFIKYLLDYMYITIGIQHLCMNCNV